MNVLAGQAARGNLTPGNWSIAEPVKVAQRFLDGRGANHWFLLDEFAFEVDPQWGKITSNAQKKIHVKLVDNANKFFKFSSAGNNHVSLVVAIVDKARTDNPDGSSASSSNLLYDVHSTRVAICRGSMDQIQKLVNRSASLEH